MRLIRNLLKNDSTISFLAYTVVLIILMTCATPGVAQVTSPELQVNISPQGAVDDGAMWRYKQKDSPTATWSLWWESGQSLEIYSSTFLVEFKDTTTADWVTPDIREVIVGAGEHKVVNVTYQSANSDASITVTLNPVDVRTDARWSLYFKTKRPWPSSGYEKHYIASDLKSGETYTFDPSNYPNCNIECSFVKDLARPYDEQISISPGENIEITRKYKDLVVGDVHIFGNKLEYGDNKYKTYGTTRWAFKYNSGTESVKYVKCMADLKGSYTPALIKGNGTLHANEDLGSLENMFSAFNDKIFYKGKFLLDANTLKSIETSAQKPIWDYLGISFTLKEFQMFKSPAFGLSQTAIGKIDLPIFSEPSVLRFDELKTYVQDSAPQFTGDVIWEGANIEDWFKIHETKVYIDTSTKTFTAEGFDVEVLNDMPSFRGDIKIQNGNVRRLSAELYGIGQQAGESPIIFDNCGFSFDNPEEASIKANITAGVKFVIPETEIEVGSESWDGYFDINGYFRVSGTREIFGYEIGNTETEIQWKGKTQYVQSSIDSLFYVGGYLQFLIEGRGYMFLQWKPSFDFNGWISASGFIPLPDWLSWLTKSGQINLAAFLVKINSFGMYISVNLFGLYPLNITIPPFWELNSGSVQIADISQRNLSNATTFKTLSTGSVENFTVSQGEAGFILSLQGNAGAPDVVLVMPDGTKIDPLNFAFVGDSVRVGRDDVYNVTGFMVNNPQPGIWQIKMENSAGVTQRLIRGNRPPQILPIELESQADGSYKLTYKAFDADNNAVITFYNSPNNSSFQGQKIGEAIENDGTGIFIWKPDDSITINGYIYAIINDGISPPARAYFKGRTVNPNAPSAPLFTRAYMSGDSLILTFNDLNFTDIDSLKVYYSDDLETENLTKHFAAFARSTVELSNTPLVPGRMYQLRVTAFSATNGESDFSARCDIDYRLVTGNNYPKIISKPVLITAMITNPKLNYSYQRYRYQLNVQDYDDDPISYSIIQGPKGLAVSSSGLIYGKFSENDVGSKSVVVQADDGNGGTDIQKFRITLSRDHVSLSWILTHEQGSVHDNLIINLRDVTRNSKSSMIDTITAIVQDSVTGIEWTVTLQETSADSGKFQGLVQLDNVERDIIKSRNKGFLLRLENGNRKEQVYRLPSLVN